jgi:hypothetical protein
MNYTIGDHWNNGPTVVGTEFTHHKCPHPGCPVPDYDDEIRKARFCVLNKPLLLYVPPGTHMHLSCPVHPEGHIIFGSSVTM